MNSDGRYGISFFYDAVESRHCFITEKAWQTIVKCDKKFSKGECWLREARKNQNMNIVTSAAQ